ncbi:MAG: hypothetical protein U0768_00720 [Anaerolineae bacterium]
MDKRVIGGLVAAGVAGVAAIVVLSPRLREEARETLALPGPAPDSLKSVALSSARNALGLAEVFEPQMVEAVAYALAEMEGRPGKAHEPEMQERAQKLVREGLKHVNDWLAGQQTVEGRAQSFGDSDAAQA